MNIQVALRLGRVSNLPTVWTNVLAGLALTVAGGQAGHVAGTNQIIVLMIAMTFFYLGGMYLNDAFDADIDAAEDKAAKLKEIEARLNKLRSPFRSAEKFWVEEIIDPRKTRSLLCEFARLAEPLRKPGPPENFSIRP